MKKKKFQDLAKEHPKLGCRKLTDICKIEKTPAANILKNENRICE